MTEHYPKSVVWEITWKCNANCIHCGSDCVSVEKQNQLTTDECLAVIDDLSRINAKTIYLSGGDPLLREDFPLLATAIKEKGMNVAFITNGIALDDEKINTIKEIRPIAFGISIDAAEGWMHDYIRGHNGCYEHALESIIKLKENGIEPSIVTTTHKLNYYQLPKLRTILSAMEIKAWQIQYADCIGRMDKRAMITEAQFKNQAEFIYETQKYLKGKSNVTGADITGYMNDLSTKIGLTPWMGCQAGMRVLGLGSDGTVRGCLSQQLDKFIEGNVRDTSLYEIWNSPNSFLYNRFFDINTLSGYCRECEHADVCRGGCSRSAMHTDNCRCNPYCLYKIDKIGYSDEYQKRIYFSQEEIAEIYNPIRPLPNEFYEKFESYNKITDK